MRVFYTNDVHTPKSSETSFIYYTLTVHLVPASNIIFNIFKNERKPQYFNQFFP